MKKTVLISASIFGFLLLVVFQLSSNHDSAVMIKSGINGLQPGSLTQPDPDIKARISETYYNLPLSFEANQGQITNQVSFISRGHGYNLFLTPTEAILALSQHRALFKEQKGLATISDTENTNDNRVTKATILRMKLLNANSSSHITGIEELPVKSNYLIGNDPHKWHTNITNYSKVHYENVYPGIDMVYYGNQRQLEYDFIVSPGADPEVIKLGFQGVNKLEVDIQGDLILHAEGEKIHQHKPILYQKTNRGKQIIEGHYLLKSDTEVGIQVAAYDTSLPLVIDPVLIYSTYLGGNNSENAPGSQGEITVDSLGNAYITGSTLSVNFPIASAVYSTYSGAGEGNFGGDAFITKLNPAGRPIFSTFLGGSNDDHGNDIAIDTNGNIYITGATISTNFPIKDAIQPANAGSMDIFITKLSSAGNALIYSTYLGGSNYDRGYSIAVDSAYGAYISGGTKSNDFPRVNARQPDYGGVLDGFVAKLHPTGSALIYSTYMGGSAFDECYGIAIDSDGNAYITGSTMSADFDVSDYWFQPHFGGNQDAFVFKLSPLGARSYSTFLGGSDDEDGMSIAVDSLGYAYVTGNTKSDNFPVQNAVQGARAAGYDAFVTKLVPSGSTLAYSTYLGGNGYDFGRDIIVDSSGNAYVSGNTSSNNFPLTGMPLQTTFGGMADIYGGDVFIIELTPTGSELLYSSYLGGSNDESGSGIAVTPNGIVYVTGYTTSTNFPTANPFQSANAGNMDGFVVRLNLANPCSTASFSEAVSFNSLGDSDSIVVGDFNLDGIPDLAVANYGFGNISILLGNGLGSFSAATNFSVGPAPVYITVGDFNRDHKLDLVTANSISNSVSILLGNGLGSFGAALNIGVGIYPASVAVGDFNADNKPDLAVANLNSHNVSILLGNGLGGFAVATNFNAGASPYSVAVGDFNRDSKLDLAVTNLTTPGDPSADSVAILLGNGLGGFGTPTYFNAGPSFSVAVGDFNLDGRLDLAVANLTNNVSILLGNGLGSFGSSTNFSVEASPFSVTVGDFNLDGKPDLVTANDLSNNISVLLGNGLGGFDSSINFSVGISPFSVAIGDFNLDGKPDLAVANYRSSNVSILLNTCL
ncbi:MAG: SBBP repeat-containing protein [Acidobacteriota bacterium]